MKLVEQPHRNSRHGNRPLEKRGDTMPWVRYEFGLTGYVDGNERIVKGNR